MNDEHYMNSHNEREDFMYQRQQLVNKLMVFVGQSLDARLNSIEKLIEKNKKHLTRAKLDFDKVENVITTYSKTMQTNNLSDEIRLFFALARNERLDLINSAQNVDQLKAINSRRTSRMASKSPIPAMTRTQTKETLSPMKSIPKLDLPHKNKTPLKQIQAPQPQTLPKAVTPSKKTPRPTLSKTPSKTDFKQPRPQTSTAGEAIANSVKRLYAGNSKTDSQPDGKVSTQKDKKKSLTLSNAKPQKPPETSKPSPSPNKLAQSASKPRLSPRNSTPKQQSGFKPVIRGNTPVAPQQSAAPAPPSISTSPMNALPKNIKLAVPTPKEDSQQKPPHRFTMQRSSSNLKKSISEIKEEIEELGSLPRDSHIRPERAQRGFEEPDDSRLPSHIITPNNLSSFMELLNYNSQSSEEEEELHHHQKLVPVRQPLDHRDKDSTQDFIRDAMATGKSEKDSKELRPAPKPGLRTPPKNWIQPTVAVADHPLCTFAPLVRIKPIKHSTRLTCTQPSPLDFSELTPLVGSAEQKPIKLRTDLPCEQEDITVLKASISKIMSPMVSPMRKLGKSPEYYAPGSDEQSDEEEADHRIRVNPQLGQVRAFRVQPEKKQRSATPDVVESILEDYLEEPVQVKKHSLRRTQMQGTPERLSFKQPLLLSPQLPEDLFGFEGSDLLFTDSKSASGIQ